MTDDKFQKLVRAIRNDQPYDTLYRGFELSYDQFKELESEIQKRTLREIEGVIQRNKEVIEYLERSAKYSLKPAPIPPIATEMPNPIRKTIFAEKGFVVAGPNSREQKI